MAGTMVVCSACYRRLAWAADLRGVSCPAGHLPAVMVHIAVPRGEPGAAFEGNLSDLMGSFPMDAPRAE